MVFGETSVEEFHNYTARFPLDQMEELRKYAKANRLDMIEVIKDGVNRVIHGGEGVPGAQFVGEQSYALPVAGSTHGGPWAEPASEGEKTISVTRSLAEDFNIDPSDQFLRVRHDSMVEAGIVDGSYVLMHFLEENEDPKRYEIALIELVDESEERKTTLKRWLGWEGPGRPRLEDGAGDKFEVPEGVLAKPIMVARAVLTQL